MFDLLVVGGRIVDPAAGTERCADVGFADGRVAAIAETLPRDNARSVIAADGKFVVPIQNRYSFTDLSEITCRWEALAGEKVLASGESHIAAKPRTSVDASFPATPGMDTLRLEFIHPDGRGLYVANLRVKS